jgi:hypothetical protein
MIKFLIFLFALIGVFVVSSLLKGLVALVLILMICYLMIKLFDKVTFIRQYLHNIFN